MLVQYVGGVVALDTNGVPLHVVVLDDCHSCHMIPVVLLLFPAVLLAPSMTGQHEYLYRRSGQVVYFGQV
jgi:hypothetical protein